MEQNLLFLINRKWTNPSLDWAMAIITDWNFWMPFILAAIVLFAVFGGIRGRGAILCAIATVVIVDSLIVANVKHAVGRPRPYMMLTGIRKVSLTPAKPRLLALAKPLRTQLSETSIEPIRGPSFPSAHVANNFAVATVFFLFFRRWGWILFISAALIGYSRIYVGSHWPLDVLAASLIGIGTALIFTALVEIAWRRWSPRLFPKLARTYPSLLKPRASW